MEKSETASSWADLELSSSMLEALETIGFQTPTPIQQAVIPSAIKQGKDIIGAAETGSGKTLAFAIPILERWSEQGAENVAKEDVTLFALIISPTRELAIQTRDVIKQLSAKTGPRSLNTIAIVGGISEQKQQRLLKSRPDVIVATPGRLWALRQTGEEHLEDLSGLRMLVVDEIDRMLEQGHFEELRHIVQDINRFMKEQQIKASDRGGGQSSTILSQLQTLIFSATLTFTHHIPVRKDDRASHQLQQTDSKLKVLRIVQSMCMRKKQLALFDLTTAQKTPQSLIECRMNCMDLQQKDSNLLYVLKRYGGRTLVFGNSVSAVRRLQALLRKLVINQQKKEQFPRVLHGRMKEKERLKSLQRFEAFDDSILLATDVAARGLDFRGVQNIIHYQVPKTTENYIHRSGRTARAANVGLSVLFVDPLDLYHYQKICQNLNKNEDLELLAVDNTKLMNECRQLVELASEAESLEHRIRKRNLRDQWFERIAREADLDWEEGKDNKKRAAEADDDGPSIDDKMIRRRNAVEKALRRRMIEMSSQKQSEEKGKRSELEEEIGKTKLDREEMRKRLRLEKGTKKWVKRRKTNI